MTRRPLTLVLGLGIGVALACGNDHVRRAAEVVEVVGGTPTVSTGLPEVGRGDGGLDASFGPSAPFQVDIFDQQQAQQVDILWVIDNSPGMKIKQDRITANIHSFTQFLEAQQIDSHLGVITTDIFNPHQSGRLSNTAGLPQPWINADAGTNAEALFVINVDAGFQGGEERGFLAGMMALTAPLSPPLDSANPDAGAANCARLANGQVDCFLRPSAPLYTIIVSDEEEKSCAPLRGGYPANEGCDDAAIRASPTGYGTTDYWSRFYSGVKGTGVVSKLAAITATDTSFHDCATEFAGYCDALTKTTCGPGDPPWCGKCAASPPDCTQAANLNNPCCYQLYSQPDVNSCSGSIFAKAQWCNVVPTSPWAPPYYGVTGSWNGCKSVGTDGGIEFTAYTGQRYMTVAQNTSGIATSICDQDYTPSLARLGLQASGLRSDFPLSRTPLAGSVTLQLTPASGAAWSYVGCENHVPINVVRFASPPPPGTRIAVSYDVNVRGLGACP